MLRVDCRLNSDWLTQLLPAVRHDGVGIVESVLDDAFLTETRRAMYAARDEIVHEVGRERLDRAGESGVLRLMMKFEPFFSRFLEIPEALAVIDATVGETAILHLQNGLLLESTEPEDVPDIFQTRLHRDFPRYLNGYLASVNVFFAIDTFTEDNGATLVVPGSHHQESIPPLEELKERAESALCPAGSMIVFDSTLVHAAGANVSGQDRLAINHQFTRSFFKQQIDYVRALGGEFVLSLPPRSQQLLGWYTRVVTSLDEYYQPPENRLYRAGQG